MLTKTVEVELTPEELAQEFCNYNDTMQVYFLNEVARIMDTWETHYVFQLAWITDNPKLTDQARSLMMALGDYAER